MTDTETLSKLRGVISKLARELNATATGEGLTPTQASVLGLIAFRGPLGLTELAQLEGLNPTMLSRVVGKLTELGLIQRDPNPDDLRAIQVEATDAGRRCTSGSSCSAPRRSPPAWTSCPRSPPRRSSTPSPPWKN